MAKIRVGIIGGAGYTAGELIRILLRHPSAVISFVHSNSQAGKWVHEIHQDLVGDTDLQFTDTVNTACDLWFLCMGHGRSKSFLAEQVLPDHLKIIDLSNEFRINQAEGFVYGLPELHKTAIQASQKIANPGCFATAIQLALLPLAAQNLLRKDLHIHALTGSTGAGQQPKSTTHFSWRSNNVSIYKAFTHQHMAEVKQSIHYLQSDYDATVNFLPVRGNFSRGIFASIYTDIGLSIEAITTIYQAYYAAHPFVFMCHDNPSLKQVVNTNKCLIHLEKSGDKLLIISMIDNLLKGASGQAVQNMNLIFGLEERAGLSLKASAF
ncbi:MAG: N-acetyl-gamma-glutamyl-phosphate reductase [Bacteroidota bacterium]